MWICNDCDREFTWPNWVQREEEKYNSFVEIPICPFCNSYDVEEYDEEDEDQ